MHFFSHWAWALWFDLFFFLESCMKGTREGPNNPVRHQQCLKPIKVAFSPGMLVADTLTVLFCFDPGLARIQWFFCKRWLMNNNVFKWGKLILWRHVNTHTWSNHYIDMSPILGEISIDGTAVAVENDCHSVTDTGMTTTDHRNVI